MACCGCIESCARPSGMLESAPECRIAPPVNPLALLPTGESHIKVSVLLLHYPRTESGIKHTREKSAAAATFFVLAQYFIKLSSVTVVWLIKYICIFL